MMAVAGEGMDRKLMRKMTGKDKKEVIFFLTGYSFRVEVREGFMCESQANWTTSIINGKALKVNQIPVPCTLPFPKKILNTISYQLKFY